MNIEIFNYVGNTANNCNAVEIGPITFYFSYKTLVAFRDNRSAGHGLVIRQNQWGNTTGKHLNAIDRDQKKRVSDDKFQKMYNELSKDLFGSLEA